MKRIVATIKIALLALRRNKLRTFLTMLGMIIGVGAVIAMVGIGNGAKSQLEAQIASLGRNVITVFSGSFSRGGARSGFGGAGTLILEDAEAIQREIPGITVLSPEVRGRAQVAAGNENWSTQIYGESPDYFTVRQWPIVQGASFSEVDVRSANKVALLGKTVVDQLYPGVDPVGEIIRIRNVPFKIIGVVGPKGVTPWGQDQDDVVIVPYTSAMKRLFGVTTLQSIVIQTASPDMLQPAQDQITDLLRQRHRIIPPREDDFGVRNQQEIADATTAQSKTMAWLLAAIACVSLLVGGIGIMNIMLVSVTERTREIGIRMAVGARGADILWQFLIEAVTLSMIGGIIGILAGLGMSRLVEAVKHWPIMTPIVWIVVAFLVSAAVGVFLAFTPLEKRRGSIPLMRSGMNDGPTADIGLPATVQSSVPHGMWGVGGSRPEVLRSNSMKAEVLSTHTPALFDAAVRRAAELLRQGKVAALPTETVYGLAANALDPQAVAQIYEIKGRPAHNPIIVHVAGIDMAKRCVADWPSLADRLAAAFWPGPLTLVLPRSKEIPDLVTAGGATVGVRWPGHPFIQAVIHACGFPLAAPSANLSNQVSPTTAGHVQKQLGDQLELIIDGGSAQVGIESTVLDLTVSPPRVLRPGMIHETVLEEVSGVPSSLRSDAASRSEVAGAEVLLSPGLLRKHYAPKAKLVVLSWRDDADLRSHLAPGTWHLTHVIAHSRIPSPEGFGGVSVIPHDAEAFARAIYAELHRCDDAGAGWIVVETPPETNEWRAIADRLKRAAAI